MPCRRTRQRMFWKIVCFFTCSTCLIMYSFPIIHTTERKSYAYMSSTLPDRGKVKYIFNLEKWREFMLNDGTFSANNRTYWCDIPDELRIISDAICRIYNRNDCTRLPCQMIYTSASTLDDVKCSDSGRIMKTNLENSLEKPTDFSCKRGYSLDLFLRKSNHFSYPSIIGDGLSSLSKELYIDVLNKKFRSYDSIWGLSFNFESITNYPSAADRKKLKLFDVTFGYDRLLYDFIPPPWLFNYVEQLVFNSKRLSMQKAMDNKKSIHPLTTSHLYWTNTPMAFQTEKNKSSSLHVTAPILWMNTNCKTASKRTEYMFELMKYIAVDNYGNCGTNILNLPDDIINIQNSINRDLKDRSTYKWEAGKLALSSRYLFTIAIENSINHDYITEKLWHSLVAGSVPIYLGAPNIQDWLPCHTNCIIDLTKFKTAKDAASYIESVAMNRTLYQTYHQWRNEPISQKFQNLLNYFKVISDYSLDCILCHISNQASHGNDPYEIKTNLTATIGRF